MAKFDAASVHHGGCGRPLDVQPGLLSIIVPVYNVAAYLDACVQSLVGQAYRQLEIILIDDGSTDACPAMCDAWAARDGRIRVIHSANHGVSHARNLGLDAARGEYIGFCDADDWVEADYYARMVETMRQTGAEVVEGGYIRDDGERTFMKLVPAPARVYSREEAFGVMFSYRTPKAFWWELCDKLFAHRVLAGLRLAEDIATSEDMLLTGQIMLRVEHLAIVPLYGYHYRVRPGSATQGGATPKQSDTGRIAVQRLYQYITEQGPEPLRQIYEKFWCYGLNGQIRGLLRQPADAAHTAVLQTAQQELRSHLLWLIRAHLAEHHLRGAIGSLILALPLRVLRRIRWLQR